MSLLSRYKTWVRANSSSISAVEGGLSGLTWLLPRPLFGVRASPGGVQLTPGLASVSIMKAY